MSVPPELANLVSQWMEKADHDLMVAEHTLQITESCPYDQVCFHAQQCVEKYMKALLVSIQTPFPKTHDLEQLRLMLPPSLSLPASVADLAKLTPHATNSRYPDEWRAPEKEEAEWAVALANSIRAAVRSWLLPRLS